jgi:recombination protein RecA
VFGNRTKVKVVKNKLAPPFREAEFDILFGEGVSYEGEIIDLGESCGVVQKSGAWFAFGERRLGQGRDKAREALRSDPALRQEIEHAVLSNLGLERFLGDEAVAQAA